jgi:hypothetical protein
MCKKCLQKLSKTSNQQERTSCEKKAGKIESFYLKIEVGKG